MAGAVLAVQARHAEQRLRAARAAVTRLRSDLVKPDVPQSTIEADAVAVGGPARAAADITDGPLWKLAQHLPVVGSAVTSARGTSDAVRDLALHALPDLTTAQEQLRTDKLQTQGGISVAPLRTAAPLLTNASTTIEQVLGEVRALPASTRIGAVDHARGDLLSQLTDLSGQARDAADAARVLPTMLGGSGTRNYFLGFENEAESRGLGGLPGAFAILQAKDGKLSLTQLGSDRDLDGTDANIDLGAEFDAQYSRNGATTLYQNSDLSPNFPDAAQIWMGMWKTKTGQSLDGAIVIDPTALGALLSITGGTHLADGTQVTGANVAELTERTAYTRFGGDDDARKEFLLQVAKASADRLVGAGPSHAAVLARTAARQVGERRILVYSAHADEESVLTAQPIGGILPPATGANAVTSPFLMVAVNNGGGSKLDYWLGRQVTWTGGSCSGGMRTTVVTVTLTNGAPAGLPESVTGPGYSHDGLPLDTNRALVSVYATAGAGVLNLQIDGKTATTTSYDEQGRPVFVTAVDTPQGTSSTLTLRLLEPTSAKGAPVVLTQPLVLPQKTTVSVPAC